VNSKTYFELGILEKRRGRRKQATQALENALIHFERVGAGNQAERTKQELDNIGKKSQ
jgi:hypothetical protein